MRSPSTSLRIAPFVLALVAACGGVTAPKATSPRANAAEELPPPEAAAPQGPLPWEAFEPSIFTRAQAAKKLVILDNSAEWCHWCHVMEATTYHDASIRKRIDAHFLAAKVDIDERPDLEERYRAYGWPATVIFSAQGEELGVFQGYLTPEEFGVVLDDALAHSGATKTVSPEPVLRSGVASAERFAKDRAYVEAKLDALWDSKEGGWGGFQKAPIGWDDLWLLEKARRGDKAATEKAAFVLDAESQIHDAVFGGIYQYSVGKTWKRPHFEKLGALQALSLWADSEAAQLLTGDAKKRAELRADRTYRYIERFLRAPLGGFYTSQDADVGAHRVEQSEGARTFANASENAGNGVARDGGPETPGDRPVFVDAKKGFLDGHSYYEKGEAERLTYGIPRVDRGEYGKENGLFIRAYLAYSALGHPAAKTEALRAIDRFLETHTAKSSLPNAANTIARYTHGAGPVGAAEAPENRRIGHLADHVYIGLALVRLAGDSALPAEKRALYKEEAGRVANVLAAQFAAPDGGFYGTTQDPGARGVFAQRRKPVDENAVAVLFFLQYAALGEGRSEAEFRALALDAATALGNDAVLASRGRMIGPVLFALDAAEAASRK